MGKDIAVAVIATLIVVLGSLYALGYLNIGGKSEIAIDPATGHKEYCKNVPGLVKERQLYNVYVIGRVDPDHEKILPPDRIIITQEDLDKRQLAWLSINSQINGYLYTTTNDPQMDVGYRGRIWFYDNAEYRMAFKGIPSNWNCENYPNSPTYRPNGARYLLRIVWVDVDRRTTVDTYEQTIYVKYKEGGG